MNNSESLIKAGRQIARLRAINAELVRAAKDFIGMASAVESAVKNTPYTAQSVAYCIEQLRSAVAKATG